MSKHTFTADEKGSQKFFDELQDYMHCNVMDKDTHSTNQWGKFKCVSKEKCKKSCGKDIELHWGQLHHVGPLYDLKRDGKPFRIVVSGSEYGYEGLSSLRGRTEGINDAVPDNPHMRGTLCLLQILFGEDPDNYNREVNINGKRVTIFRAFSLANRLLCSAIPEGQKNSSNAYTHHMLKYCRDHYQKTLEILQPQILVLQGQRAWTFFWERYDVDLDYNYESPEVKTIEVGGNPVLVLPLCHPSYRRNAWGGAGYTATNDYVKPAVETLLTEYDKLHS